MIVEGVEMFAYAISYVIMLIGTGFGAIGSGIAIVILFFLALPILFCVGSLASESPQDDREPPPEPPEGTFLYEDGCGRSVYADGDGGEWIYS